MTEFTFGNPATISLSEAMRRRAVDILKGLAERLDGCDEQSDEINLLLSLAFDGWKNDTNNVYSEYGGYMGSPSPNSTYFAGMNAYPYTSSLDSALALVTRLYPSLVIVMCRCADGSIEIREAWDAEDDRVEVGHVRGGRGGLPVLRCLVAAMIKRVEVAVATPELLRTEAVRTK